MNLVSEGCCEKNITAVLAFFLTREAFKKGKTVLQTFKSAFQMLYMVYKYLEIMKVEHWSLKWWVKLGVDRLSAPILSILPIIDIGHFQNRFADNYYYYFLLLCKQTYYLQVTLFIGE